MTRHTLRFRMIDKPPNGWPLTWPREQTTTSREREGEACRWKPAAVKCSDGMDSSRDSNGISVPELPYAPK